MEFAFGFLLGSLIALAASTTPEQALCHLKAWADRLKGSKPQRRVPDLRDLRVSRSEEHNSGGDEEDTRGGS